MPARDVPHEPFECGLQTEIVEHARAQAEREIPHGPNHGVDELTAFAHGVADRRLARRTHAIDASQLEPQRGQRLSDLIVQFAREVLPLLLLCGDDLLRELAHLVFRVLGNRPLLLGPSLEHAQPRDGNEGDEHTQEQGPPQQLVQIAAKRGLTPGHLGALCHEVRVVQFFDLQGNRKNRLPLGEDLPLEEAGAAIQAFGGRPVEHGITGPPVRVELGCEARDVAFVAGIAARERAKLGHARRAVPSKLSQAPPVVRPAARLGIEEVVAHENACELHVRPQAPQLGVHIPMVGVELVELRINLLSPARRGQDRHDDERQQTKQAERGDRPGSEPHVPP